MIGEFNGEFRWLSNFHPCTIKYMGLVFQSTEAAYQAAKCRNPEDRKMFIGIPASAAKKLGRKVMIRPDWNSVKLQVMEDLIRIKFAPGSPLFKQLVSTGTQELIEGNYWGDTFWGSCNGIGHNHLGRILMQRRTELREQPEPRSLKGVPYTGIGSRKTPAPVLTSMKELGQIFAKQGLVLRSGGAEGADTAFEQGCDLAHGSKEIYIPWPGFGNRQPSNTNLLGNKISEAEELAKFVHPNWAACSDAARKLHSRNCFQILGTDLDNPTKFVVFWAEEKNGNVMGGTGQAIRIARRLEIPCFNLYTPGSMQALVEALRGFMYE